MKKIISLIFSLALIGCLMSCATIKTGVELSQERTNVASIEIYHLDRAYYEGDIHTLLENNEPVSVLNVEQHTPFLNRLCLLEFEKDVAFFPIPMDGGCDYEGYVVAVVYTDGGYDIVAQKGLYSYAVGEDGQGKHKYDHPDYCGEQSWNEFVEEYIRK